jgi:hypothetical protein
MVERLLLLLHGEGNEPQRTHCALACVFSGIRRIVRARAGTKADDGDSGDDDGGGVAMLMMVMIMMVMMS